MAVSVLHDMFSLIIGLYILRFLQLRLKDTAFGPALAYLLH